MDTFSCPSSWSKDLVAVVEILVARFGPPTETNLVKALRWWDSGHLVASVRIDTVKRWIVVHLPGHAAARALGEFVEAYGKDQSRFSNLGSLRYGGELSYARVANQAHRDALQAFLLNEVKS